MPACCCGGPPAPVPGPPATISGQLYFPTRTNPQPTAIYAITTFVGGFDIRYVMTRVQQAATTYHMSLPPGQYQFVARMDSEPLSGAGYLQCYSSACSPVMTRSGFVTCQSLDCQPALTYLSVYAGQSYGGIDIGGWGSLAALDRLWTLDEYGAPYSAGAVPAGVTPSPAPAIPTRQIPEASTEALTSTFTVHNSYGGTPQVVATLHLPAGWRQVLNPGRAFSDSVTEDFTNQDARSSLSLAAGGLWLTIATSGLACPRLTDADVTARAFLRGIALYFEDPHSAVGVQPFSGYSFVALVPDVPCVVMRFTAQTAQEREAEIPTFLAIVAATAGYRAG